MKKQKRTKVSVSGTIREMNPEKIAAMFGAASWVVLDPKTTRKDPRKKRT